MAAILSQPGDIFVNLPQREYRYGDIDSLLCCIQFPGVDIDKRPRTPLKLFTGPGSGLKQVVSTASPWVHRPWPGHGFWPYILHFLLRAYTQSGTPLGDAKFRKEIETVLSVNTWQPFRGRPKRATTDLEA